MSDMPIRNFQDILKKYRSYSFSEKDKGARFESLMQRFLKTYPLYEGKFKHIWLWNEFPYHKDISGKDTGIDLVAQTTAGDFWAIQCKCWSESSYIDKASVDSFLSTSSKTFTNDQARTTSFSMRLWISTADIAAQDYNLSVSTYVEQEDKREVVDITVLNTEIERIVAREDILRREINEIIKEITV